MASLLKNILNFAERFSPAEIAYAHCDIPCGIYDPHEAQMSAHTVIRMDELISQLKEKESTMSKEEYVIMLSVLSCLSSPTTKTAPSFIFFIRLTIVILFVGCLITTMSPILGLEKR